jgi:hypothetical protein
MLEYTAWPVTNYQTSLMWLSFFVFSGFHMQNQVKDKIIVECPYCKSPVKQSRIASHVSSRCEKSPLRVKNNSEKAHYTFLEPLPESLEKSPPKKKKSKINLRLRLDRIYEDLCKKGVTPDDPRLAEAFKLFYKNNRTMKSLADNPFFDPSERSTSVRAVSGGLPSLGKRSK